MRLPRPTTRRLMAAVAVVAKLSAGGLEATRLVQLSRSHRRRVAGYAAMGKEFSSHATRADIELREAEERLIAFRAGRVPDNLGEPERSMLIRSSRENPIAYKGWLDDKAKREGVMTEPLRRQADRWT